MRISKLLGKALCLAAATLFASAVQAQAPKFAGVGSSAMFQTFALSAVAAGGLDSGICGDSLWTKRGGGTLHDPRPGIPNENGNVFIVWNDLDHTQPTCVYVTVDSVVGDRGYFAIAADGTRSTLLLVGVSCASSTTDTDRLIPAGLVGVNAYKDLPADICTAVNGVTVNAGLTDIRPEDALFATRRALTIGYGPSAPVRNPFSGSLATPVNFAVIGNDPISGRQAPSYTTLDVGAAPIVVIANNTAGGPTSGNLGSTSDGTPTGAPIFTNVNRFVLTAAVDGSLSRTRDLIPTQNGTIASVGLKTHIRELISGTMNTFEYSIPNSLGVGSTQEAGCDAVAHNPCDYNYASGGRRSRVIGTGQMVSQVNSTANGFGYTFWSYGNFGSAPNVRYLALDGVDPIQASYVDGSLPTCPTPSTCPVLTFPNVANGSYPAWALLHVVTSSPVPTGVSDLVNQAQLDATSVSDFIPAANMLVFRDHRDAVFAEGTITAKNGHIGGQAAAGLEMGGAVLTVQQDQDFVTDNGVEIVGKRQ